MNPVDAYDAARTRMIKNGTPIPNQVLRGYLDHVRAVSRFRSGPALAVVTITDDGWLARLPKIRRPVQVHRVMDAADENRVPVRVSGQHWAARP